MPDAAPNAGRRRKPQRMWPNFYMMGALATKRQLAGSLPMPEAVEQQETDWMLLWF
jgi:hypothetical protein